uniref:Uncharacterized protein n=1 Tax=Salix viminalis TaxID=40686 RepID=A0A6N2LLA8_SALVM
MDYNCVLSFQSSKVHRREPELIKPAKAYSTMSFKLLSDIDDQEGLRFHIPVIQFYRNNPSMQGKDPVKIIREALAKTLVFYYPFAGRLREGPHRKLMVECTGEGILFKKPMLDVYTRSSLVMHFNHLSHAWMSSSLMSLGLVGCLKLPFVACSAMPRPGPIYVSSGEMARGANAPSVPAVWERQVLNASNPPRVTCTHREYEEVADTNGTIIPLDDMAHRSFFFGPSEISALRKLEPHKCIVNARRKFTLHYQEDTTNLVRKAKADVTEEYMRSVSIFDWLTKGGLFYSRKGIPSIRDLRRAGFEEVDFGWRRKYRRPAPAMERFVKELGGMLKDQAVSAQTKSKFIVSAL